MFFSVSFILNVHIRVVSTIYGSVRGSTSSSFLQWSCSRSALYKLPDHQVVHVTGVYFLNYSVTFALTVKKMAIVCRQDFNLRLDACGNYF